MTYVFNQVVTFYSFGYTQHVPIPMQELYCTKRCCVARYCPLVLSWAMTVHKFQGFEAGFDEDDNFNNSSSSSSNNSYENYDFDFNKGGSVSKQMKRSGLASK